MQKRSLLEPNRRENPVHGSFRRRVSHEANSLFNLILGDLQLFLDGSCVAGVSSFERLLNGSSYVFGGLGPDERGWALSKIGIGARSLLPAGIFTAFVLPVDRC